MSSSSGIPVIRKSLLFGFNGNKEHFPNRPISWSGIKYWQLMHIFGLISGKEKTCEIAEKIKDRKMCFISA